MTKELPTDGRHITWMIQSRKCGGTNPRKQCKECRGHGPYWYAYFKDDAGKHVCKYMGKVVTDEGAEE